MIESLYVGCNPIIAAGLFLAVVVLFWTNHQQNKRMDRVLVALEGKQKSIDNLSHRVREQEQTYQVLLGNYQKIESRLLHLKMVSITK